MDNLQALNSDQTYLPHFNYAIEDIRTWRNRYSKTEYARKLMINTFYKDHNVNFMWDKLFSPFKLATKTIDAFNISKYQQSKVYINQLYSETKISMTQPVLLNLISQRKDVGILDFEIADKLVLKSNNQSIEELEFTYIFSYITNELLFNWCACGMIGISKEVSLSATTGYTTNVDLMINYKSSMKVLGQLFTSKFLERNYKKLPNFY